MSNVLEVLEEALDVGLWRWWDAELPTFFAVEFDAVKLWTPPELLDQAPRSVFGLGFKNPYLVAFLTEQPAVADLDANWPQALHADRLAPFSLIADARTEGSLTLQSGEELARLADGCSIEYLIGSHSDLNTTAPAQLGFRVGPVGLIVWRSSSQLVQTLERIGKLRCWKLPTNGAVTRRNTGRGAIYEGRCHVITGAKWKSRHQGSDGQQEYRLDVG